MFVFQLKVEEVKKEEGIKGLIATKVAVEKGPPTKEVEAPIKNSIVNATKVAASMVEALSSYLDRNDQILKALKAAENPSNIVDVQFAVVG